MFNIPSTYEMSKKRPRKKFPMALRDRPAPVHANRYGTFITPLLSPQNSMPSIGKEQENTSVDEKPPERKNSIDLVKSPMVTRRAQLKLALTEPTKKSFSTIGNNGASNSADKHVSSFNTIKTYPNTVIKPVKQFTIGVREPIEEVKEPEGNTLRTVEVKKPVKKRQKNHSVILDSFKKALVNRYLANYVSPSKTSLAQLQSPLNLNNEKHKRVASQSYDTHNGTISTLPSIEKNVKRNTGPSEGTRNSIGKIYGYIRKTYSKSKLK